MKTYCFNKNMIMNHSFFILLLFFGSCGDKPENNDAPAQSTKVICLKETTLFIEGKGNGENCSLAYINAIADFKKKGREKAALWCQTESCSKSTCIMLDPVGYKDVGEAYTPNQLVDGKNVCICIITGKIAFECVCK